MCVSGGYLTHQFEELKRAALQESSRKREELHERIQKRAQEQSEAQRVANERLQQRAAWVAREQQRQAQRQALEDKKRKELEAQDAKRRAAARLAEQSAMEKARGRPPPRAKALDHAHAEAVKHRLQVPRASSSVALTRDEKRMKRMAKEMGVKFRPNTKPVRHPTASAPGKPMPALPAKRPMTPRERFIMEEHQRKEARKATLPASPHTSDSHDSDRSGETSDDENTTSHASIRDQIWQMFGRDRQRHVLFTNLQLPGA